MGYTNEYIDIFSTQFNSTKYYHAACLFPIKTTVGLKTVSGDIMLRIKIFDAHVQCKNNQCNA